MNCKNCGAELPEESSFCSNCGYDLRDISNENFIESQQFTKRIEIM